MAAQPKIFAPNRGTVVPKLYRLASSHPDSSSHVVRPTPWHKHTGCWNGDKPSVWVLTGEMQKVFGRVRSLRFGHNSVRKDSLPSTQRHRDAETHRETQRGTEAT
eukprot:706062-Amphidinium_carterae.3